MAGPRPEVGPPRGLRGTITDFYRDHQYVALKVYVHTSLHHRELPVYDRINSRMAEVSYKGRGINNIRKLLDTFEVTGPHGKHAVLVFEPAQMSLRDMRFVFCREGFAEEFVKGAITELLKALDFLHSHGEIVHTGIVFPGSVTSSSTDTVQTYTPATCCLAFTTIISCVDWKTRR